MPIYMDIHLVPGVKAHEVAKAHQHDLMLQDQYGCKCMTYWVDEGRESIFCLIDAPTKEAVEELHGKAHGMIPNKIIEVNTDLVSSFLGRIYDPENIPLTDDGLKVFADPSFRVLLLVKMPDPALLEHDSGNEKAQRLMGSYNEIIRSSLVKHSGTEVEYEGNCFIISFLSASRALSCAQEIQREIGSNAGAGIRMSINGGEPIARSNKLFGDTLQLAAYMCSIAGDMQVVMASAVKELLAKEQLQLRGNDLLALTPQEENLLHALFIQLEENWQQAEFDIDDYCRAMAMSKSQLYRKTIQLTGLSPNILLREFRLEKAKELMRRKSYSISQITFDSGFSSPSYFTKCFKKKFGLLPMTYLDLLH